LAKGEDLRHAAVWLAGQALEQDRPIVLFQLVCSRLYELKIERPGITVIEQNLVGAAREDARKETARRVQPRFEIGSVPVTYGYKGLAAMPIPRPTSSLRRIGPASATTTASTSNDPRWDPTPEHVEHGARHPDQLVLRHDRKG